MTPQSHRARLPKGLPNTPIESLRELALAVVVRALTDDDHVFMVGEDERWADYLLHIVGLDDEAIVNLKVAWCLNRIDVANLDMRRVHSNRFPDKDRRNDTEVHWQTWGSRSASA